MPITKLDLCKPEWLELVFDDRNTAYGAYDLRKHYSENVAKALGVTVVAVLCLFVGYGFVLKHKAAVIIHDPGIIIHLTQPQIAKPPVTPPKHVEQHRVNTVKLPPFVVKPDNQAVNPPKDDEIKLAVIGQETVKGTPGDNLSKLDISDSPPAKDVTESTEPVDMHLVEVMPKFPGGEAAFSRFLQKNLRYPGPAEDAGVGGKVFVSFIVEKDGHISDVTVLRGAGYGMDEEATRVLKLVPAWIPGIQNGHPVRVKYSMAISFQPPSSDN